MFETWERKRGAPVFCLFCLILVSVIFQCELQFCPPARPRACLMITRTKKILLLTFFVFAEEKRTPSPCFTPDPTFPCSIVEFVVASLVATIPHWPCSFTIFIITDPLKMMMMKHNISRSNGGVGERLFTTSRALSPSDDETTTQTSTTSYSANTFPFGRPSSLSAPPPTAALFPTTTRTNTMTMTAIGARLDAAVAAAKPVNRSADLVPLTQDYYKMKKQLKSLANAARVYHLSMLKMNEARREVCVCIFCVLCVYIFSILRFYALGKI